MYNEIEIMKKEHPTFNVHEEIKDAKCSCVDCDGCEPDRLTLLCPWCSGKCQNEKK